MSERDVTTAQWEIFFRELQRFGNVSASAEAARISRTTVYRHVDADKEFAERFAEARRIGNDGLEDEARRRGAEGYDKPIHYQGVQTDTVREYSDSLMAMLLKGNHPKYRENRLQMSGPDGGPIEISDGQLATKLQALAHKLQQRIIDGECEDITDQAALPEDGSDLI